MRRALFVFIFAIVSVATHAQGYRGRDFWICFPQNAVQEEESKILQLSLYIASENRTNGTIANLLDNTKQTFTIESGASIERDIDTELEIRSSEQKQHNALHITSDQDISLYVVDHRPASSDSYMAIPTEFLGKEYVIAGYTSLPVGGGLSYTSQATIIGTEDNTLVTIHLAGPTLGGLPKGRTLMFCLNRGETYQIQGASRSGDLTGSTVSTTKPVGFFTGHSCAQVPNDKQFCDILLESEPPTNDWGKSFILTKLEGKDYFVARVIANSDSTEISINGKMAGTINRGEFYEVDTFFHDAIITTSKPALVGQYCTSSSADALKVGDPFMLLVVPNERFLREVTTSSVTQGAYKDYLNIVVPDTAIASLVVDGMSAGLERYPPGVSLARKGSVPNAKATVLTLHVPTGRHLVQCAAPMAVYSYGFGLGNDDYDSYGHACGMRMDK